MKIYEDLPPRLEPDLRHGVFETMLIVNGAPVELDAHLARLAFAIHALFAEKMPAELPRVIGEHCARRELGRVKVTVARRIEGERLGVEVVAADVDPDIVLPGWERASDLVTVPVRGGLGAFKWADRRLLDRATAGLSANELLTVVDENGAVLETSRANVFAVTGDALSTPPLDSRMLPGIARARTIEAAREAGVQVRETELAVEDLVGAGEVFLTGSVRGVEPARSIDGLPLGLPGEIVELLAQALRQRWIERPAAVART